MGVCLSSKQRNTKDNTCQKNSSPGESGNHLEVADKDLDILKLYREENENVMSFQDENSETQKQIGQGRFSKVFKTFEFQNGGYVAEKIVKLRPNLDSSEIAAVKQAVSQIVNIKHPNLV